MKNIFVLLGSIVLILIGLSIALKHLFVIVNPVISYILDIVGGVLLIYCGLIGIKNLIEP